MQKKLLVVVVVDRLPVGMMVQLIRVLHEDRSAMFLYPLQAIEFTVWCFSFKSCL